MSNTVSAHECVNQNVYRC